MPKYEQEEKGGGVQDTVPKVANSTFNPGDAFKRENAGVQAKAASPYNWSLLTVAEKIRYRDEITRSLPALELSNLNLEEEMLSQYHVLRELQAAVMTETTGPDAVPANQRASVANSVAATLKTLGDMQIALYNSERFKDIENALIRELSKLPEETAAAFIESYEKILLRYAK